MTFTKCQTKIIFEGGLCMPYCQNCGAEVEGNFCPNCGAQAGAVVSAAPTYVIHENAVVKPRYTLGQIILAGYLGLTFIVMSIAVLLGGYLSGMLDAKGYLGVTLGGIFCLFLAFLCFLPGIRSICKHSPKNEVGATLKSFIGKSLLFIVAWGVTLMGCCYIIGIFFKVWRLGLWASGPNYYQYTAYVDGKKIPVARYYDDLPSNNTKRGKYVFKDNNGEFHRPPVK